MMGITQFSKFQRANDQFCENLSTYLCLMGECVDSNMNEDDVRDKLALAMRAGSLYLIKTEVKVDAFLKLRVRGNEEYWLIDLVLYDVKNQVYLPIEVKFDEENTDLILDDITKVGSCLTHIEKVSMGIGIFFYKDSDSLQKAQEAINNEFDINVRYEKINDEYSALIVMADNYFKKNKNLVSMANYWN